MTTIQHAGRSDEECVVQRLRECGTSSLEELPRLAGLDWVPVYSIIDRLTRSGVLMLERHGVEYRVSLAERP